MVPGPVFYRLPAFYPADPPDGLGVDRLGHPVGLGQHLPVLLGYPGGGERRRVGAPPGEDSLVWIAHDVQGVGRRAPLPDQGHLQQVQVQVLCLVHEHHVRGAGGHLDLMQAGLDEVGEIHQSVLFLPGFPALSEGHDPGGHPFHVHPGPVDLVEVHQLVAHGLSGWLQVVAVDLSSQVGGSQAHPVLGFVFVPLLDVVPALGDLRLSQGVVAVGVQRSQAVLVDGKSPSADLCRRGLGEG